MNNLDDKDVLTNVTEGQENSQNSQPSAVVNAESEASLSTSLSEISENTVGGVIGAFIFSLAGGIVWFLLYQIGYIAAISGIIGVICALKGYEIFAKKLSTHGIIISALLSVIVIIVAWYLCLSKDLYDEQIIYNGISWVQAKFSFSHAVQNAYKALSDSEIMSGYIRDLALGLVFCIVGGFSYVKSALRKTKGKEEKQK